MTDISLETPLNVEESTLNIILPEEILELVVDHLSDNKPALLLCRLVCSRWLHRSRRWLHLDATLAVPGSKEITRKDLESSEKFIELLQSPHLKLGPSDISKLIIIGPDRVPCTCCDTIGLGDSYFYDVLNLILEASLPFMGHIRDLRLSQVDFTALSDQVQAQITGLSQITSLDCYGVTFDNLIDMLAPFQNIKALKADGVVTAGITELTSSTYGLFPLSSVNTLFITVTVSSCPILSIELVRPQNIVSLTMFTNAPECVQNMVKFIAATGSSLEHLDVDIEAYVPDVPITLNQNNHLKTLILKSDPNDLEWFDVPVSTAHHETQITVVFLLSSDDAGKIEDWSINELKEFFDRYEDRNVSFTVLVPQKNEKLINNRNSTLDQFIECQFPEQYKRGLVQAKKVNMT